MFPTVPIEGEILNKILDAFEETEYFTPTTWGKGERSKAHYDRNVIVEEVSLNQVLSEIYLRRDKSFKYDGKFSTKLSPRSFVSFKFDENIKPDYWPHIFDLSNKLAEIIKPSYGVTHIFWPAPDNMDIEFEKDFLWMDYCAQPAPVDFIQSGPAGAGMRTYFSGKVMELFSKDFLQNMPAIVSNTDWDGLQIDLHDKPWQADVAQIVDNFKKTMVYLEQKEVLAIPEFDEQLRGVTFSPNTAWRNRNK